MYIYAHNMHSHKAIVPAMKRPVLVGLAIAAAACGGESKDAAKDYLAKSKRIEAKLALKRIEKSAKDVLLEKGAFPKGKTGPIPAERCCEGQGGKCAAVPDATWSADPIWQPLMFEVYESPRFQYAYESDGDTLTATATGDLDCDGTQIVYKLEMKRTPDGNVTANVTEPPLSAD
jgi:hypothetical protein